MKLKKKKYICYSTIFNHILNSDFFFFFVLYFFFLLTKTYLIPDQCNIISIKAIICNFLRQMIYARNNHEKRPINRKNNLSFNGILSLMICVKTISVIYMKSAFCFLRIIHDRLFLKDLHKIWMVLTSCISVFSFLIYHIRSSIFFTQEKTYSRV